MNSRPQQYPHIRNRWRDRTQDRTDLKPRLATAQYHEKEKDRFPADRQRSPLHFFVPMILLALTILPTVAQMTVAIESTEKIVAEDGARTDNFGHSIATGDRFALIGAPWKANRRGSAYLFDASSGQYLATFLPDGGGFHEMFGATVALDGDRALVGTVGPLFKWWRAGECVRPPNTPEINSNSRQESV